MTQRRKTTAVELGSRDWFAAVGRTSLTLGSPQFEESLVSLFGGLIDHTARWVIRFSDVASPEVMHTVGVPAHLVEHYRLACSSVDPFAAHWRLYGEAGVRALSQFKVALGAVDPGLYNSTFKPAANISDELGLFLSTIGQSSIGLFLEREVGEFTEAEIETAKAAFPILNGLQRAHIGRVFDRMRYTGATAEIEELNARPMLVQDRHGVEIYANSSWQSLFSRTSSHRQSKDSLDREIANASANFTLSVEHFDKYFPLAPGGRMLTLMEKPSSEEEQAASGERFRLLGLLTPRERDVFNLIMSGGSTSTISKMLSLTKGTVKNYKLRIYKKAGAFSERALIQRYAIREARKPI